ncbi:hypothetical protein EZV73_10110 [Acidaminobacter sp. JC074]|uniref:hypothetical protein n=1 Tax=Acidaminobacter sp. JC074 TaxID=2530199 RepID=UPI001F113461|nr:hypothetical protein [Acidaminobacter sp. JC074]MCH4887929.1 hypothetical protein [Acidaminobacter sp. JC074]
MTSIYKKIFTGFLLVLFDINLGVIDILPDPLGFFFILTGLMMFNKKEKSLDLQLGSVISGLMMVYTTYLYFSNNPINSASLSMFGYVSMIVTMILSAGLSLIIYNASIRAYRHRADKVIIEKLVQETNQYAIINALSILALSTVMIVPVSMVSGITVIVAIVVFVLQIRFMFTLNRIKNQWILWEESTRTIDIEV